MRSKTKKKTTTDASFVFKGTVKRPRASNVEQAEVSDRTAIVTVDEVIEAPRNLSGYKGQAITVELSGKCKVKTGDRLIFNAISWLFGDGIAVRSLFEEADKTASHRENVAQQNDQQLRKHFDNADLVVSGKVIEVRLPQSTSTRSKGSASTMTTRVSEHDPKWREAVIEVDKVHKGSAAKKRVVVRFPASTDVAWRRAPKFEAGQQGYFMLHKPSEDDAPTIKTQSRRKGSSKSPGGGLKEAYVVRDPNDFESFSEPGRIKSLIEPD